MRFKRIDQETVRCLISENELNENGLELDDFLNNKGKTEDFLRKIIAMAEQEVDYKVQGGAISVQVAVIENNTLALTLSEKQQKNILEMLENLKSAVEVLAGTTKDSLDDLTGKKSEENSKEEKQKKKQDKGAAGAKEETFTALHRLDRDVYELEFASLAHVMKYSSNVDVTGEFDNCLYKLESNGYYYLLIEHGSLTQQELCKLLGACLDFSEAVYSDGRMKAYLEEHGKSIIKEHAIQHLKEI